MADFYKFNVGYICSGCLHAEELDSDSLVSIC